MMKTQLPMLSDNTTHADKLQGNFVERRKVVGEDEVWKRMFLSVFVFSLSRRNLSRDLPPRIELDR